MLDASALTDFATERTRYAQSVIWVALRRLGTLVVPTISLASAAAQLPATARDALRVVMHLPVTVVDRLDEPDAWRIADLLAGRPVGGALEAAQVVDCARRRDWPVLTARPDPLLAVDDKIVIDLIP